MPCKGILEDFLKKAFEEALTIAASSKLSSAARERKTAGSLSSVAIVIMAHSFPK
jgi:hypothetical protein